MGSFVSGMRYGLGVVCTLIISLFPQVIHAENGSLMSVALTTIAFLRPIIDFFAALSAYKMASLGLFLEYIFATPLYN